MHDVALLYVGNLLLLVLALYKLSAVVALTERGLAGVGVEVEVYALLLGKKHVGLLRLGSRKA